MFYFEAIPGLAERWSLSHHLWWHRVLEAVCFYRWFLNANPENLRTDTPVWRELDKVGAFCWNNPIKGCMANCTLYFRMAGLSCTRTNLLLYSIMLAAYADVCWLTSTHLEFYGHLQFVAGFIFHFIFAFVCWSLEVFWWQVEPHVLPGAIRDLILCVYLSFLVQVTGGCETWYNFCWLSHCIHTHTFWDEAPSEMLIPIIFLHLLLITFRAAIEGSVYMIPVSNAVPSAWRCMWTGCDFPWKLASLLAVSLG